jgi:hypothetical protein
LLLCINASLCFLISLVRVFGAIRTARRRNPVDHNPEQRLLRFLQVSRYFFKSVRCICCGDKKHTRQYSSQPIAVGHDRVDLILSPQLRNRRCTRPMNAVFMERSRALCAASRRMAASPCIAAILRDASLRDAPQDEASLLRKLLKAEVGTIASLHSKLSPLATGPVRSAVRCSGWPSIPGPRDPIIGALQYRTLGRAG